MTTGTTYTGFLNTGSGSDKVVLTLGGEAAHVAIRSRWMGLDVPLRCELSLTHHRFDERHGVLTVNTATTAPDDDADPQPLPELTDEDALLPLTVEYLHVPDTRGYLHPGSMLAMMRPLGYATFKDRFDLLLLVHDEGWPEGPVWEHIRSRLDKAKLERTDV